jgi:dTDP-4-dehydrorhamnose reductase
MFLFKRFYSKKTIILFYGSKGWIGTLFLNYLKLNHHDLTIIEGVSRIENETEVKYEIKQYRPTNVVSFTGRTHGVVDNKLINTIDYLEYPGKLVENIRDNLTGPVVLANLCKKHGIHYTYLGTGCIFNSDKNSTFDEKSKPNYFGSGYSIVKGFTDTIMQSYSNALNLRIRMPISSTVNDRNFITKITKYSKICSMSNSMTVLDDFFPIFIDLITNKKTGTYNCTNPGTISHDEILTKYKSIIDNDFVWENMTLDEQNKILKSERSNNCLNTNKIQIEYPKLKGIKDSVDIVLNRMKLN